MNVFLLGKCNLDLGPQNQYACKTRVGASIYEVLKPLCGWADMLLSRRDFVKGMSVRHPDRQSE